MLCTTSEQASLAFTEKDVKFCYDTDVYFFCYLPYFSQYELFCVIIKWF